MAFTYDALGRVLNQTGPLGTVASQWDLAGRRTRLTWPDSFHVTYDHLVTGETTTIRENGAASGIGVIATLVYDDLGRRKSLTLGNGLATHYQYDPAARLAKLKLELPGTADDLTADFTYNPASQIATNVRSNDSYAWTGHGSGTTSTTANGLNQIAGWTSPLGYDAKGNIASDGAYGYSYSSENLLTQLTNSAPGALQPTIAFAYDPLMRLASIDSASAGFDVAFGYDGQEMVFEGLSAGRTRRYVFGPGIDEPLVGYLVTPGAATTRLWYQADERGSIVRLSNDAGTPGTIGKYDEYGLGGTSRFRYTGQYWLGEANLLYYRARIYDSRLGRFLQPDPIGYGAGMNLYAYVGGDPVNFTDPSGLQQDEPDIYITGSRATKLLGFAALLQGGGAGFDARFMDNLVNLIDGGGATGQAPDPRKVACEAALEAAGQDGSAIARAEDAWPLLSKAAENLIDPRMLAAIAVRESGFRNVPEVGGGIGRGVFQITGNGVSDTNAYNISWSAAWAAQKLNSDFNYFKLKYPEFNDIQLSQATAAAYNFGRSNITGNPKNIDKGTARDNYGSNVLQIGGLCFPER